MSFFTLFHVQMEIERWNKNFYLQKGKRKPLVFYYEKHWKNMDC